MMGHRLLILALTVSIAFNLGFVGTIAYNRLSVPDSKLPPCLSGDGNQPRVVELSERLQQELEPLRHQQADETRRLAELIAAAEPDHTAIDSCLDRLTAAERSIQGLVVETILAQQAELPESQRAVFCNHVRRRLCDPWIGCGANGTCNVGERESQPPQPVKEGASK